jgi:hypothetical protein
MFVRVCAREKPKNSSNPRRSGCISGLKPKCHFPTAPVAVAGGLERLRQRDLIERQSEVVRLVGAGIELVPEALLVAAVINPARVGLHTGQET